MKRVLIKKLSEDAVIPKYATSGSAGFDFVAIEDVEISPGETKLIKTGLAFAIPQGFEIQVRPRSGLSLKTKLRVSNAPGTIDADFRGQVCVIIDNIADSFCYNVSDIVHIKKGDRIAQGVLCPVYQADFVVVDELDDTERGPNGFGSTGG